MFETKDLYIIIPILITLFSSIMAMYYSKVNYRLSKSNQIFVQQNQLAIRNIEKLQTYINEIIKKGDVDFSNDIGIHFNGLW